MKLLSKIIKAHDQNFIINSPLTPGQPYHIKPKARVDVKIDQATFAHQSLENKQKMCEDILKDAEEMAQKIIEHAQTVSLNQIKEATERANQNYEVEMNRARSQGFEVGKEEGRKKGLEIGYQEGLTEGKRESEEISRKTIEFMHGVIEGIDDGRHDLLKKYQDDLKDLAFIIAQKIVRKEMEEHTENIKNIIENAAQMCKNQDYLRVVVSPESYKLLLGDEDLAEKLNAYSNDVKFVPDATMKNTDCIIETPLGMIDAGVDTQLENVKAMINDSKNEF